MPDQNFNVWNSFTQGMGLMDKFASMRDDARQRQRMVAQDQAMQELGQNPQLLGFEDDPNAVRPQWLTNLYRSNPDLAMKMEAQVAQPFSTKREIQKAGDVERMKRESDAAVAMKMAQAMGFMPPEGTGSVLAPSEGQAVPGQGGFLSPLAIDGGGPGHSGLSRTMKITPQGPAFEMSQLPPHQIQNDLDQRELDRKKQHLAEEQQVDVRALNNSEMIRKSQLARKEADDRVNTIMTQLHGLPLLAGKVPPEMIEQQQASLKQELDAAMRYRHDLLYGMEKMPTNIEDFAGSRKDSPDTRLKTGATAQGSARPMPTMPKPTNSTQAPASGRSEIGANLPYPQKIEAQKKATEQSVELATKSIQDAHTAADKFAGHLPSINRLFELVSKKDLGNRLGQLPGGETALRIFSQDNDELQKLRNELIDTQKQEGQSQLMNTLPELAIQSDALPSVTNSPDVNKRSMVNLRNLAEARLAAPGFLQNWADQHGKNLDGARQAFREWMQHNQLYQATETNGRVSVAENDGYIPVEVWSKLKQRFSTADILKKRDAGHIQVINGRAFLKE